MYLRRYTIVSLLFIGLVFAYVYTFVSQNSVSIDLFGIALPQLPVALWVAVPIVIFYFASVLHMAFYSFTGSFKLRKYKKDYDNLVDELRGIYLFTPKQNYTFKTDRYNVLGNALSNVQLELKEGYKNSGNAKLDPILDLVGEIVSGKSADIKKLNLDKENTLRIKNDLNRLANGDINSEDILTKSERYGQAVLKEAYRAFVKTSPLYAIEKYKEHMTKETLMTVLGRINAKEYALEASNEALLALFEEVKLNENDYISASALLSTHMIPDQRIKLFELLSEKEEKAMEAYLYTLFDVEMVDKASEILDNAQEDEYIQFRAYRSLREHNQNYNINLFTKNICN